MSTANYEENVQSCSIEDWRAGKVKRITKAEAQKRLAKVSAEKIAAMEKEDADIDKEFKGVSYTFRGTLMGRPKKEIRREVAAIRIPADALKEIKALGSGWSTRAGDALARLIKEGAL